MKRKNSIVTLMIILLLSTLVFSFGGCVENKKDVNLTVYKDTLSLQVGDTYYMYYDFLYGDLSYISSDETIASINEKGIMSANKTGEVTVTVKDGNQDKLICTVKVTEGVEPPEEKPAEPIPDNYRILLDCSSVNLLVGSDMEISAKVFNHNLEIDAEANWSLSDSGIVELEKLGNNKYKLTAKSAGTVKLIVSMDDNFKATCEIVCIA